MNLWAEFAVMQHFRMHRNPRLNLGELLLKGDPYQTQVISLPSSCPQVLQFLQRPLA